MNHQNSDRAISSPEDDKYGFVELAKKLAPSVANAADGEGMVVAVEGKWGSGKTSLLNFLNHELVALNDPNLHVLVINPWLQGDRTELVSSLIAQISSVLEKETSQKPSSNETIPSIKKQADETAEVLRSYAAKSSKSLSPLLKLGGLAIPGLSAAGDAVKLGGEILESWSSQPNLSELKNTISDMLRSGNSRFVVLVDDLDRLEPNQASEVMRLVRSVADFPKIAYLLCFDRDVLSAALEIGLGISNGESYLQKIVQLSFPIPLPEPFDLRLALFEQIVKFLVHETGKKLNEVEEKEIWDTVQSEGNFISVPRDVTLIMNAIKFAHNSLGSDAYFPDICRIQIIRATRPKLYRWLEDYLSVRSILVTSDASLNKDERKRSGKKLKKLLPDKSIGSSKSIWYLKRNFPGLKEDKKPENCVFQDEPIHKINEAIEKKRISSPLHSRLYFAFAIPKAVMSDDKFSELHQLAANGHSKLTIKLSSFGRTPRPVGGTWLSHIIDRLDTNQIENLSEAQLNGWVVALSNSMDKSLDYDSEVKWLSFSTARRAVALAKALITQLRSSNEPAATKLVNKMLYEGIAINWLVGDFFRTELFAHGKTSDVPRGSYTTCLTTEELMSGKKLLETRLANKKFQDKIEKLPQVSNFIYGWRDLSGLSDPKAWVDAFVKDDKNFLTFLMILRNWQMSDRVSYPLRKSAVEEFFDWDETLQRLELLKLSSTSSEQASLLDEVNLAIKIGASRD